MISGGAPRYRIRAAAIRVGVSAALLRAWERRYGLVEASRTASGYRIYSEEDVGVLRGARRLTATGLSIAEVAQLPRRRLSRAGAGAIAETEARSQSNPDLHRVNLGSDTFLDSVFQSARTFDAEALERLLQRAAGRSVLTSTEMCETVLLPVLTALGERWEAGQLSVAAEHFGSQIVRARLTELVEIESRRRGDGPIAVCACPAGERHEGALLAFAVHAASRGLRVVYLGADTPVAEILWTADDRDARLCALSATGALTINQARNLARAFGRWRRAEPRRRVVAGGRGIARHVECLRAAGLEIFDRVSGPLVH